LITEDFFKLYEEFLKDKAPKVTVGTIKDHRITLTHLKNFQTISKYKITLDSINVNFYNKVTAYLIGELKHSPNTVAKFVKNLRTFLNYLTDHAINTNMAYKSFKKPKHTTDIITLNKQELDTIFTIDLSNNPRLDKVRDLFVFACATGLRFSDMANLKEENIKKDFLELTTIKTHQRILVPLNSYSRLILAKYEGTLPKMLTNQRMNEYMKKLGK
jgi:site-specific recombinase XerD